MKINCDMLLNILPRSFWFSKQQKIKGMPPCGCYKLNTLHLTIKSCKHMTKGFYKMCPELSFGSNPCKLTHTTSGMLLIFHSQIFVLIVELSNTNRSRMITEGRQASSYIALKLLAIILEELMKREPGRTAKCTWWASTQSPFSFSLSYYKNEWA